MSYEALVYPSPQDGRPHLIGLPRASVQVAQHTDGRWMWAITFSTSSGGEGYAPHAKWGRFTQDRDAAVKEGIKEMLERLARRNWTAKQIEKLLAWAREQAAPKQQDMFSGGNHHEFQ